MVAVGHRGAGEQHLRAEIDDKAIDRVHRVGSLRDTRRLHADASQMGQRKTVRVFQLIAEDTIESRVLDIR